MRSAACSQQLACRPSRWRPPAAAGPASSSAATGWQTPPRHWSGAASRSARSRGCRLRSRRGRMSEWQAGRACGPALGVAKRSMWTAAAPARCCRMPCVSSRALASLLTSVCPRAQTPPHHTLSRPAVPAPFCRMPPGRASPGVGWWTSDRRVRKAWRTATATAVPGAASPRAAPRCWSSSRAVAAAASGSSRAASSPGSWAWPRARVSWRATAAGASPGWPCSEARLWPPSSGPSMRPCSGAWSGPARCAPCAAPGGCPPGTFSTTPRAPQAGRSTSTRRWAS
mmetsp:Transcript_50870/g.145385  ORF Transcript_50870/g.145385 Transcript_50870/m.145385 type:complete len:284 (-) Transcript_50870:1615-2466(-)